MPLSNEELKDLKQHAHQALATGSNIGRAPHHILELIAEIETYRQTSKPKSAIVALAQPKPTLHVGEAMVTRAAPVPVSEPDPEVTVDESPSAEEDPPAAETETETETETDDPPSKPEKKARKKS
jgi:hypothetical protein